MLESEGAGLAGPGRLLQMNEREVRKFLQAVKTGAVKIDAAVERLRQLPYEDLGFAKIDHHRSIRQGFPEVIFARKIFAAVKTVAKTARFHELSGAITVERSRTVNGKGLILVVTAGTSDIPVAEEALVTARMMGHHAEAIYDVGVAGLHRLLEHRKQLTEARVIICVAGMEGALPSVVAGLVAAPVVAVPTSTGYGSSFGGLTA